MSHLLRLVGHNQPFVFGPRALISNRGLFESMSGANSVKPFCKTIRTQLIMTSSTTFSEQPKQQPGNISNGGSDEKKDNSEYVIKFKKGLDIKKVLKDLYSIYGPLFVVSYIGVGLTSLGFFCSLTYLAIDLNALIPDFIYSLMGETLVSVSDTGGKFVVAYAIHKLLLPVRLGIATYITKILSKFIKRRNT